MSAQELVQVFYDELWNAWNDAPVDEVLDESFEFRGSLGQSTVGRDQWRSYRDSVRTASADFHNEVVTLVASGAQVAARLRYTGTHTGRLLGIPATGRRFEYAGAAFFVASGGRLASAWVLGDLDGLRRQLLTGLGLHHLGLTVRNANASAAWYAEVLGFHRVGEFDSPDGARRKVFLRHDGLRIRLGLTEHRKGSRDVFDETRAGLDHLAFAVADRDELIGWATRLATLGVVHSRIAPANSIPGAFVLVLRDPDNIQLELFFDPTDPPP